VLTPGEARQSTYIRCGRFRAGFVLRPSGPTSAVLSLPTDPPWVWYHLPTEIMVSAVDVAPRGLRVLVYYICPRNPGLASVRTCAHPPCARKESPRYRRLERTIALLARAMTRSRINDRAQGCGGPARMSRMLWISPGRRFERNFGEFFDTL
jgi:hypothetical protein